MALSNLSLTYQQLGQWKDANLAIQDSIKLLNQVPENSRLLAQTLDIQGKLQRETGKPAAAIDAWQRAANIYEKREESAALAQNNLNQAQALQDLGLYPRACQKVLASLGIESVSTCKELNRLTTEEKLSTEDRLTKKKLTEELKKISAEPSLMKVSGLRNLGDLLLVLGQPQRSHEILEISLKLATKLNSPSEIAATYLSIGKTSHSLTTKEAEPIRGKRRENQKQARKSYRQAIAISPDLITQQQARLNQLSLLLQLNKWSEAASLSQEILTKFDKLPPGRSNIFAQINFAHILVELLDRDKPQPPDELQFPGISELERILANATKNAQTLGDKRAEAYALGNRGRLYELTGELPTAEQYTQQAISLTSSLDSPDIAYQYFWQLGRIENRQEDLESLERAIAAYTKAYDALQSLRSDLATINPELQFSFRDEVEPVYRELVELDFKYAQNAKNQPEEFTAKLSQARDVIESLQIAQLNNFFREACIEGNPQQIDAIDPNAAVIYTIVLPNKLGILLSLPDRSPSLYQTDVTQAEISKVVDPIRRYLKASPPNPDTSDEETLRQYQQFYDYSIHPLETKLYDWLIRPLEAELVKNKDKVQTIAFVLDGDLRSIPMSILHDGKQYLVEKYALGLTPGLQLLDPKPLTIIDQKAIAAGLSENQDNLPPLPEVEVELQTIRDIGLSERYLLNNQFTQQAVKQNIVDSGFPIVHLATHAEFRPQVEDSFILSWDGRINIKKLDELLRDDTFKRKNAIELLVLSACQTAAGDSRATLGLAGVAVQSGARSTLATLWSVADRSTVMIMEQFYLQIKQAGTNQFNKAEALRQAQLALMKDKDFNHPHYWAPFILIGNWQ